MKRTLSAKRMNGQTKIPFGISEKDFENVEISKDQHYLAVDEFTLIWMQIDWIN